MIIWSGKLRGLSANKLKWPNNPNLNGLNPLRHLFSVRFWRSHLEHSILVTFFFKAGRNEAWPQKHPVPLFHIFILLGPSHLAKVLLLTQNEFKWYLQNSSTFTQQHCLVSSPINSVTSWGESGCSSPPAGNRRQAHQGLQEEASRALGSPGPVAAASLALFLTLKTEHIGPLMLGIQVFLDFMLWLGNPEMILDDYWEYK